MAGEKKIEKRVEWMWMMSYHTYTRLIFVWNDGWRVKDSCRCLLSNRWMSALPDQDSQSVYSISLVRFQVTRKKYRAFFFVFFFYFAEASARRVVPKSRMWNEEWQTAKPKMKMGFRLNWYGIHKHTPHYRRLSNTMEFTVSFRTISTFFIRIFVFLSLFVFGYSSAHKK